MPDGRKQDEHPDESSLLIRRVFELYRADVPIDSLIQTVGEATRTPND
jgi:hypothetical protein